MATGDVVIGAMVLAAGRSRRMGVPKLFLPVDDQPLIVHLVDELLRVPVFHLVVVTGPDGDRIGEVLAKRPILRVNNPESESDMLGSVRCGLRALEAACTAVLVVPGDAPGLEAGLVRKMVAAYVRTGGSLVVPAHEGRRGHPLLLDRRYQTSILERYDGVGLRGLLQDHPGEVVEVPASASVLANWNRPEDYLAWQASRISDLRRSGP